MEQIIPKRERDIVDINGDTRRICTLPGGQQIYRSRLNMMNFLHTKRLPTCFHVHHEDENTQNDDLSNLQLLSKGGHAKIHHPRDYKYGVSMTEDKKGYMTCYNKVYWQRNKNNTVYRGKQLDRANAKYQATKDDPVLREKRNANGRKNYLIRSQDPVWMAENTAKKRAYEAKKREEKKNEISQLS